MILALVPLLLLAPPASFDELLRAGLIALNQNDLASAQKQLEAASKIQPGRAEVWLGLAQTYWKQHQLKLADAVAAKADPLAAGNAAILREIASAFAGYQKANPRSYLGSFLPAKALVLENGDPARIESLLRESIAKDDGFWESHFELGLLLEKRRDFAGAAGEIEKAVA